MDFTDNSKLSHPRKPYYWLTGGPVSSGLPQRRIIRLLTPPVDPITGLISGAVKLPDAAGSYLLTAEAAQYSWLRLYADGADMSADLARTILTLPPTTPIILDAVLEKSPLVSALSRAIWGPGPGCAAPGNFGFAVDADMTTWWSSSTYQITGFPLPAPMVVGTTFSVDFGSIISFQTLTFGADANGGFKPPATVSVEISNNGVSWLMMESGYVTNGSPSVNITLSSKVSARYIRLKAVTLPSGPSEWAIFEFNVYLSAEAGLRLRLSNADEWGIPAFNWEDSAQAELFYTIVTDPVTIYMLYTSAFNSPLCHVRGWAHNGPGNSWVPGPYDAWNYGDCYLTGELPVWPDPQYTDPGGIFPRYYLNANELRCGVQTGGIARFGILPSDLTLAVGTFNVHRSPVIDTTTFVTGMCYFVFGGGSTFASKPYLFAGLQRATSGAVNATIYWVDSTGTSNLLNSSGLITCALDGVLGVRTEIVVASGITTCNVYVGGTLEATAVVPVALTSLPSHGAVGWDMLAADPPGAPDAWGGLAVTSITIAGGLGRATVDIGYVPVEAPGGTLRGLSA